MPTDDTGTRIDPAATIAAACHEPFAAAWVELESRLDRDLVDVVRRGSQAHLEAMASVGLDGDPPPEWEARSERLLEYRRAIAAILEPLGQSFEHHGPAATIERAVRATVEQCVSLCGEVPDETFSTWTEGALAHRPSDRLGRRLGKFFARRLSAAREAGSDRWIPLRGLAVRHLEADVAPGQERVAMEAMEAWVGWGRRLELAWIEWADAALLQLIHAEMPDGEEAAELWAAIRGAAEGLQARLEALVAEAPRAALSNSAHARLDATRGPLEAELAIAGSFLLRPADRDAAPGLRTLSKVAPALQDWDRSVASRTQLYLSLLGILSGATGVQRRLVWRVRQKSLSRIGEFLEIGARLDGFVAALAPAPTAAALRQALGDLDARVGATIAPTMTLIPEPALLDAAVQKISDSTVEALLAMVRQAPSTLELHPPNEAVPSGARKPDTRSLPLQELARQSFDALRIERIRSSTAGLLLVIDEVRSDVSALPEVFSFARDEALRELDEGEAEAEGRAKDLVAGALQSMAESLRTQVVDLEAAVTEAQLRLAAEIRDGSLALLNRVGAGRMQAQLLAARSRVADFLGWVKEALGPPVHRTWRSLEVLGSRVRTALAAVLGKASALVGKAPPAAATTRTIRVLADAKAFTQSLPLVYQRLFTLEPLSDPVLLAGRSAELEDAMERWKRWQSGDAVPLIMRGREGSGITSFLNVFMHQIEADGGSVVRVTLDGRVTDEAALARLLATSLGLPAGDSLDDLAGAIFHADEHSLPAAVSLDNLEHVYLRVPRGTDLIERLLTLMAEAEPRIFWIGGITASAWQLICKAEPTAVSQVDVFDLQPLSQEAVRTAIMVRHRRSGLDVRYEEPSTGRALLKRRLRRIRDRSSNQSLLEDDFFDRLYRTSGGSLRLALFQWLLSADFGSGDRISMSQPERPDFSVLEALDLTQNFTLKAFLEHRTLTLEEHDKIFRLPRHESYQILESLRNRQLIGVAATGRSEDGERSEIETDLRYRLRPLLTGAVIAHLQGRNIVH